MNTLMEVGILLLLLLCSIGTLVIVVGLLIDSLNDRKRLKECEPKRDPELDELRRMLKR